MIGILSKPVYICLVYMYLYELGFPDLPLFFFAILLVDLKGGLGYFRSCMVVF